MTIIRWKQRPALSNMMDNLFDRDFMTGFERNCGCVPATNILEKNDSFEIQLALPGMKKEDFNMEVENNILTVTYDRKEEEGHNVEDNYLRREYHLESFTRSFTIPKNVDIENIRARYENGMLLIAIPRLEPKNERLSKKIDIA